MRLPGQAIVHVLPSFRLTGVAESNSSGAFPVHHSHRGQQVKYWRCPVKTAVKRGPESLRRLPLILDGSGAPWIPACMWLLDRARAKPLSIESLKPLAQDLAAYKVFLDELALEWDDFSAVDKYLRPTYLYRAHIGDLVALGQLKISTARRRMTSVVALYRFLSAYAPMDFEPLNAPWVEKGAAIAYRDHKGFAQVVSVKTTDLSFKRTQEDVSEEIISDGGKLRPLPEAEQKLLISALRELGNIEYELMHLVALLTGAREMTVLTLRLRDVLRPSEQIPQWSHKIRCGTGTGIDTKGDKSGVYLSVPRVLYQQLHAYAVSSRAMHRRARTELGEDPSNYLFLTQHGQPYYESKEDRYAETNPDKRPRRSSLTGRPLRKFIERSVIPLVRKSNPAFHYRFHDLRATFAMNWVDFQMADFASQVHGEHYLWAREELRKLMWHKSALTTDRYLQYRNNARRVQAAQKGWSDHLVAMVTKKDST